MLRLKWAQRASLRALTAEHTDCQFERDVPKAALVLAARRPTSNGSNGSGNSTRVLSATNSLEEPLEAVIVRMVMPAARPRLGLEPPAIVRGAWGDSGRELLVTQASRPLGLARLASVACATKAHHAQFRSRPRVAPESGFWGTRCKRACYFT
jgi:hypothetical protein